MKRKENWLLEEEYSSGDVTVKVVADESSDNSQPARIVRTLIEVALELCRSNDIDPIIIAEIMEEIATKDAQ